MKNLKKIRVAKGMSLEELAFKAKVTYGSVVAYDRCDRNAGAVNAVRIARALGTTVEKLIE